GRMRIPHTAQPLRTYAVRWTRRHGAQTAPRGTADRRLDPGCRHAELAGPTDQHAVGERGHHYHHYGPAPAGPPRTLRCVGIDRRILVKRCSSGEPPVACKASTTSTSSAWLSVRYT